MRKSILYTTICLFCLLLLPTAVAAEEYKPFGTNSGDYVIYRDYSWKDSTWVGFLYYNESTYGAFLYTPRTKTRVSILFSGEPLNDEFILTGQNIISDAKKADITAVNYLMGLLPNLYKWKTVPSSRDLIKKQVRKDIESFEFGGKIELNYASFIPLFHLHTLKDLYKKTILDLEYMGSIQKGQDSLFFDFEPPSPTSVTQKKVLKLDKNAKKETRTVDGIPLNLDAQWTLIADNSFFLNEFAFLTVGTLPNQITSDIPGDVPSSIIKLFSLSGKDAKIYMPEMKVTGTAKKFKIEQTVYDVPLKKNQKAIKLCIQNKNNTYTIISLTVDENSYNLHKSYFDKIF